MLANHFESVLTDQGFNKDLILSQWESLKTLIYSYTDWENKLKASSWKSFNRSHKDQFPNLIILVDLILTIPASTADCERGFSAMKRIKTDWRCRLATSTLADLMCILLVSSPIDVYDPSKACNLWADDMIRKPTYVRVKSAKKSARVDEGKMSKPIVIDEGESSKQDVEAESESASSDESESGSYSYSEYESENDSE